MSSLNIFAAINRFLRSHKETESLLFLRRQIGYLCVKQPATYGIQFWLFAFNYLDLPLVKMLRTLKPYLLCRFWQTRTQLYAILQANVCRKMPEKTALRQQIAQLQTVIVLSVCGKGLKSRLSVFSDNKWKPYKIKAARKRTAIFSTWSLLRLTLF